MNRSNFLFLLIIIFTFNAATVVANEDGTSLPIPVGDSDNGGHGRMQLLWGGKLAVGAVLASAAATAASSAYYATQSKDDAEKAGSESEKSWLAAEILQIIGAGAGGISLLAFIDCAVRERPFNNVYFLSSGLSSVALLGNLGGMIANAVGFDKENTKSSNNKKAIGLSVPSVVMQIIAFQLLPF